MVVDARAIEYLDELMAILECFLNRRPLLASEIRVVGFLDNQLFLLCFPCDLQINDFVGENMIESDLKTTA